MDFLGSGFTGLSQNPVAETGTEMKKTRELFYFDWALPAWDQSMESRTTEVILPVEVPASYGNSGNSTDSFMKKTGFFTEERISLENKIVLSICIRILTEEYLLNTCQIDGSNISRNQTSELIARFKKKHPTELSTIKVLNSVNLMTPENIHVNTFMYEPLIDMSAEHLIGLYKSVIQLSACPRETTGEPSDEP